MERIQDRIVAFLPWDEIEGGAKKQIENIAAMSFIHSHVAVMPDCHQGKGAPVGTVIATEGAVIPAAVGVDIGCGMIAVRTEFNKMHSDLWNLKSLREGIERRIPASKGRYNKRISPSAQVRIDELRTLAKELGVDPASFDTMWREQLGTLGSGNHFIELAHDTSEAVWAVLHSGSRGVGNKIANHYIGRAQQLMKRLQISLPDRDLAYLTQDSPDFPRYLNALHWAQEFARLNRDEMMDRVLTELSHHAYGEDGHQRTIEVERINCHHNFTQLEHHLGKEIWVTRKGAVRATRNDRAMIPGSMGARSYIVSGLENPMAFHSAPHGAGRRFSRGEARRRFTMADMERQMGGIEYRHAEVLLDEIPSAYKDIDAVMAHANELVSIDHTLKQFLNVKGD
jgi:tRNA-splicing ligase RtcB